MNRTAIRERLVQIFNSVGGDFHDVAEGLFNALGYQSERKTDYDGTYEDYISDCEPERFNRETQAALSLEDAVASIKDVFQITTEEISQAANPVQGSLTGFAEVDEGRAENFTFVSVELRGASYPRGKYAAFTRVINRINSDWPAVILFKTATNLVSLAFINRRPNKRDAERDVLGSVSVIREIDAAKPHHAHLDILADLSLPARLRWMDERGKAHNFDGLLEAWLYALDTEELNKSFFNDLLKWFDRAVEVAKFPANQAKKMKPQEHVIRLITRMMFVWFIKQKGLVADDLFIENRIRPLLKDYDAANTLLGIGHPAQIPLGGANRLTELNDELRQNRERHFHAGVRREKLRLRREDRRLRRELAKELEKAGMSKSDAGKVAGWDPYDQNASTNWFDTEYMFGVSDGFDVVIGNPPYAKIEHLTEIERRQIRNEYKWLGDLYEHFIFKGIDFVASKGIFSYIANDSYVTFSTKQRIRDLMLKNQIIHLVRSPNQTFDASIYAAIFVMAKSNPLSSHSYSSGELVTEKDYEYRHLGNIRYSIVNRLPNKRFLLSGENDLLMRLMDLDKVKDFCHVLDTGIDSGNVRRKLFFLEDNGNRDRLLQGRQIGRYSIHWGHPRARYMFCNVNYQTLPIPGIGRGGRPSKRNEYWKFRGSIENHHQPERLLMRQTDDDLVVSYHSEKIHGQFYTDNTLFTILPRSKSVNLRYLIALFNSKLVNYIYQSISQEQGKSQAQVKVKTVNELPLVVPDEEYQQPIIELVDRILKAKAADPDADVTVLEWDINALVYELYGLTENEIDEIEGSLDPVPLTAAQQDEVLLKAMLDGREEARAEGYASREEVTEILAGPDGD